MQTVSDKKQKRNQEFQKNLRLQISDEKYSKPNYEIMNREEIDVNVPFGKKIIPSEYDPAGGEYLMETFTIWAVVSGASQGGTSSQQFINISSWKLKGESKARREKLIVFRSVKPTHNYFNEIPKFEIIEAEVFLNTEMKRAVMKSGKILLNPPKEMIDEKRYVEAQKFIKIEGVGSFEFDHEMQFYSRNINWLDKEITLIIDVEEQNEITDELNTLRRLLGNKEKYSQTVWEYAIEKILGLKNESWLNPEEKPMTKEEFMEKVELESIRIYREDGFEFGFNEREDIFNGGYFLISGTTKKGGNGYDIGF